MDSDKAELVQDPCERYAEGYCGQGAEPETREMLGRDAAVGWCRRTPRGSPMIHWPGVPSRGRSFELEEKPHLSICSVIMTLLKI